MRNWTDAELESLYEIVAGEPGWLSRLQKHMKISVEDEAYLHWFDEYERDTQDKLAIWQGEIDAYGGEEIYFQANEGKQFVLLTQKINEVEGKIDPQLFNRMVATRYKLKYGMMRRIEPEAFDNITDDQIERARKFPLWRLMGLPHKKNILCPFHKERSPSFSAGIWGYCFTCKSYMDSIGYVMANRSLTFSDAVRELANR